MPDNLLIPPRSVRRHAGSCAVGGRLVARVAADADALPLRQLADTLASLRLDAAAAPVALTVTRDPGIADPEGYRLAVRRDGIRIASSTDAGTYYAIQTLRQMLMAATRRRGRLELPCCTIDDRPCYRRRGVYHDISRGKVPRLATLLDLVEQLAAWKVNELQLYVENTFAFHSHPDIGRGYSPLTAGDIRKLQAHCRLHHVRLVGSMACLGHMEKILALPSYAPLGEMPGYRGHPGGTTLCPTDPGSIRLIRELYDEFVPLFEASDFNICGDEPWELGKGRSRRRCQRIGNGRVYLEYIEKVARICRGHGKRVNAWSDIALEHPDLLGRWPRDIVMLNWDYAPRGSRMSRTGELVDAGLSVVVCPGTNAWNSHGCRLAMGMRNIADFAAEGLRCGAEGLLNTDWGDWGHRNMLAVSLHNLAWGAAHAWNHRAAAGTSFGDTFTRRFAIELMGDASRGRDLAACIRTLGSAQEALGQPCGNNTVLYSALLPTGEHIPTFDQRVRDQLAAISPRRLAAHRQALRQLRWPRPPRHASPLLQRTMQEFELATRLDALACLHALRQKGSRDCQCGDGPFARECGMVTDELRRIWRLGNRPSRLRDIVRGLRRLARAAR